MAHVSAATTTVDPIFQPLRFRSLTVKNRVLRRCLAKVLTNPLGCYEPLRFESREAMIRQVMSVFEPPPFPHPAYGRPLPEGEAIPGA
jgi:hypothetical protein